MELDHLAHSLLGSEQVYFRLHNRSIEQTDNMQDVKVEDTKVMDEVFKMVLVYKAQCNPKSKPHSGSRNSPSLTHTSLLSHFAPFFLFHNPTPHYFNSTLLLFFNNGYWLLNTFLLPDYGSRLGDIPKKTILDEATDCKKG
nr:hypothetical protein HmN_000908200 [Hymenolepis microstoma]